MTAWWYITHMPWSVVEQICGPIKQIAGAYFNGCGRVF